MSNDQLAKCRVHGIPENSTSATAFSPLVDWPPVANSCGCVHSSVNRSQACPSICFTVDQAFQTIPARSKEVFHVRLQSNYWLGTIDVLYVQCELELTKRDKVHTAVANAESDVTSLCSVVQPFNCPIQKWMKGRLVVYNMYKMRSSAGWCQGIRLARQLSIPLRAFHYPPTRRPPSCKTSFALNPWIIPIASFCLRRHGRDLSSNSFLVAKTSWLCFLFTLIPTPCHLWAHFSNVVDDMTGQNQCGKTGWANVIFIFLGCLSF